MTDKERVISLIAPRLRQVVAKRDPSPVRRRLGERLALSRGGSEEMLVIKRQRSSASQLRGKFSQVCWSESVASQDQSYCTPKCLLFLRAECLW